MPSFLLALVATTLLASPARAAGASFSVEPLDTPTAKPYFVFEGRAGRELTGRVRIVNSGTSAGSAKLYAVDATTGQTSGAVYKEAREPRRGVGSWASVSTNRVTLAPGESREVPFVVRVPVTGALSGESLGGIVAENVKVDAGKKAGRDRGRFQVKIRNLSVLAVQVNLPGPKVADMTIGNVKQGGSQGGFQAILVNLSSRGNYLLKPSLATRVENASGKVVLSYSGKLDTVVPRTAIDFPIPVRQRALGPGRYTAYITLRFAGKTINAVRRFEISGGQLKQIFGSKAPKADGGGSLLRFLPWVLLALVALGVAFRALRARAAKRGAAGAPPQASPGVRSGPVPSNGNGSAVSNGNGSAAYPSRADVASGAKAANGGELAQLLSRLDESGPRWMLGAIAHGVISGQGAAARDLRARSGRDLSQGELDHWSHRVTVVCQEIKVDRPFQVVDVSTFGTVYQMEPDVAQEIRRRLQNGHATASSHRAGTSHQPR